MAKESTRRMDLLSPQRRVLYERVEAMVGNTPLVEVLGIPISNGNRIFVKEEWRNPTGSNFDRVYPELFKRREEDGSIVPGFTSLIESSTGNAGASFAWCGQELGYIKPKGEVLSLSVDSSVEQFVRRWGMDVAKDMDLREELLIDTRTGIQYPLDDETKSAVESGVLPLDKPIVTMHVDTPHARVEHIRSLGARIVFTPAGEYGRGSIRLMRLLLAIDARESRNERRKRVLFSMTKIFVEATFPYHKLMDEAHAQLQRYGEEPSMFDYIVAVVASGDYISGVAQRLKEINPLAQAIPVQDGSTRPLSYLRQGKVSPASELTGEGLLGSTATGVSSENFNIHWEVLDDIEDILPEEWEEGQLGLLHALGYDVGRTSGAELSVALRITRRVEGKNFLIAVHDRGWKYGDHVPEGIVQRLG